MSTPTSPQATIDAFAELVARAEATAESRPRADLAGYQLQALQTSLIQLADGEDLPEAIATTLTSLRSWIADRAGLPDELDGRAAREKVRAYVVVADDLGLDAAQCEDLVARWDAATAPRPERATGRATGAAPRRKAASSDDDERVECPICHQSFKRLKMHYTLQHKGETPPD